MTNDKRWSPYYTPKKLADKILKMVPTEFRPEVVIDICAGSGNFLEASLNKKWSATKYLAFDVATNKVLESNNRWNFIKLNSLNIAKLIKHIPVKKRKLVLANPPFGPCTKTVNSYKNYSHLKSLFLEVDKIQRMEAKMLLANLSIMKSGDVFAAILPENIFSSDTFNSFRKEFLSHFSILKLGEPRKYFKACEVRTRIFVGVFKKEKTEIVKRITTRKNVEPKFQIIRGIDNSKLANKKSKRKGVKEVVHFNNPDGFQSKRKYIKFNKEFKGKIISGKDLLVIRVGRHAGRIFQPAPFVGKLYSDYFFLVKNISISTILHKEIEMELRTRLKGLTTLYIDKFDIERALTSRLN